MRRSFTEKHVQLSESAARVEVGAGRRASLHLPAPTGDVDVERVYLVVVGPPDAIPERRRFNCPACKLLLEIQHLDADDFAEVGQVDDAVDIERPRRLRGEKSHLKDKPFGCCRWLKVAYGAPLRALMIFPVVSLRMTVTSFFAS
jgi:hypothetical protein